MRLRLFRIGTRSRAIALRFDTFPVFLCIDSDGALCSDRDGSPVCELVDVGGQFEFNIVDPSQQVTINGAPVESGPLMPGDRLGVGREQFVISYERTAVKPPPAMKCRILN